MSRSLAEAEGERMQESQQESNEMMSPENALSKAQCLLVKALAGKFVRIYEAGGGSSSVLPLASFEGYKITVVDIDEVQLQHNKYADEKILGDIETQSFPPNSFDLVVCHNVIEHLPAADKALKQFYSAVAPGGLVFVSAPNPESLFGMVTKHSPHWFHVWVYRVIFRHKDAGQPGKHPFKTIFHPIVYPTEFFRYSSEIGFEIAYFKMFLSKNFYYLQQKRPLLGWLLGFGISVLDVLTFRKYPLMLGDYHAILRKPETSVD